MRNVIIVFIIPILLVSCRLDNDKISINEVKLDSLIKINDSLKEVLLNIDKNNTKFKIERRYNNFGVFNIFNANQFNIEIVNNRPGLNKNVFLSVPAAYTTKSNQIDGLFIKNGLELNSVLNEKLTGLCVIEKNNIKFLKYADFNADLLNQIKNSKFSLFQQSLLIKDAQIITCNLFNNIKNKRRALIQYEKSFGIIESENQLTIRDFQNSLLKMGVTNAINLDMGTWSEGWFQNDDGQKITIGENMINTNRQTNWITFTNN